MLVCWPQNLLNPNAVYFSISLLSFSFYKTSFISPSYFNIHTLSTPLCEMCEQKVSEPCYSCISLSAPPSAFLGHQHPASILPSQEEQDPTSLLSRPVASQIHPGSSGTSRCSHFYLVLLPGPGVWKSNFPPVSLRCNQVVYDYIHIHMYIYMGKPSYLSLKREKSFSLGFFQAS